MASRWSKCRIAEQACCRIARARAAVRSNDESPSRWLLTATGYRGLGGWQFDVESEGGRKLKAAAAVGTSGNRSRGFTRRRQTERSSSIFPLNP